MAEENNFSCLVCLQECAIQQKQIFCECLICEGCYLQWADQQVTDQMLKLTYFVSCPNACGKQVEFERLVNTYKKSDLGSKIVRRYAQISKDILLCPSKNCDYFGFYDPVQFRQCHQPLTCEKCSCLIKQNIKFNLANQFRDSASSLYKKLFSTTCPGCQISVSKISGCNSMNCAVCKTHFCYSCGQRYSQHQGLSCFRNILIKRLVFFGPLSVYLNKKGFFNYINKGFSRESSAKKSIFKKLASGIGYIFRLFYYQASIPVVAYLSYSYYNYLKKPQRTNKTVPDRKQQVVISSILATIYALGLKSFARSHEVALMAFLDSFFFSFLI